MFMVLREKLFFKDRVFRFNSSKINCVFFGNDFRRLSNVLKSDVFNVEIDDVDDSYVFFDFGGEEKIKIIVNIIFFLFSFYYEVFFLVGF